MAGWLQEEQVAAEENKAALEAEAAQIQEAIALSHQVQTALRPCANELSLQVAKEAGMNHSAANLPTEPAADEVAGFVACATAAV